MMKKLFSLLTAILFVGTMWGTDYELMLTLDVTKGAPGGSTSTALDNASVLSYLQGAAPATTDIASASKVSGDVYKGKGSGGGSIPQACLKIGKASGGGSISFTIKSTYDKIAKVELIGYGWATTTKVSVNSSSNWSPSTAQVKDTASFELATASKTITIAVTASAFCATTIKLYKEVVHVDDLSITTAPNKLNYKKGETLDLTGLKLDADGTEVTSGYEASPANGATLSTVGADTVAITYGGKTVKQAIHVGGLKSIAITNPPTKTEYNQGQTFDPTGMVVTATFSDSATVATEWDVEVDDYTYPTTGLAKDATSVTISYTYGGVTKTATQGIIVNAADAYTVTFSAGTGACTTESLTESEGLAGVELPTATIGVTGWTFAGWATAATTNTEVKPTLYTAGSTYHPTDNCTLYAVYKFSEANATIYQRATSVDDITSANKIVIAYNNGKVLNTSINMSTTLAENDGKATPATNAIFALSGDNSDGFTLTNGDNTIGATGSGASLTIALSSTNNLWTFSESTYDDNLFHVNNVDASGKSLEVYSSAWKAYALTENGKEWSMRVYVPLTVYNSNPADIVTPTVAFTTAGAKTLYVQDEASYTNAATVTGIGKTAVYSSSDETVATVTSAGEVTVKKVGTATITAKVEKEIGVNDEASASYGITVKDAKTIAGLKALTSTSTTKNFTADLTDAVVTYVNGSHAYIQDASGAVYASCGSSLTAGKKINGAVTGSIKAANQIDEITAINLDDATVTDGVVPSAAVISAATLAANKADYEGKLVSIEGATVTASLTNGSASGGKITDNSMTEINLYAPKSNIEALKDAEGTFNGYISLYNGSTLRLNIYDPSQITLTKNAPTNQPLTFAIDSVVLDHPSTAFNTFTGQTVSGNKGTPITYSVIGNEAGVVASINAETGAVVLSGVAGTVRIQASAPAVDGVDEHDIPTPWKATSKTYALTVRQVYTVTWNINGAETTQTDTVGATLTPPDAGTLIGRNFVGWTDTAIDGQTNDVPTWVTLTTILAKDTTLYAVYALGNAAYEKDTTISMTSTAAGWSGEYATYFGQPYGLKAVNKYIVNEALPGFTEHANTADTIGISVKSLRNGSTTAELTVYLVDKDGNIINGTGKAITPDNLSNADYTTYKAVGYSASEVNGKNATGYMIKCTNAGSSVLVNGTKYLIRNAATWNSFITNVYEVTFEDEPDHGLIDVLVGGKSIKTGDKFPKGTVLTVEAEPESDQYILSSLLANTTDIKDAMSFTMGNEAVTIVAEFIDKSTVGIDNTEVGGKAVKVMRNGVLYIEKNGRTYNAQGQLIK